MPIGLERSQISQCSKFYKCGQSRWTQLPQTLHLRRLIRGDTKGSPLTRMIPPGRNDQPRGGSKGKTFGPNIAHSLPWIKLQRPTRNREPPPASNKSAHPKEESTRCNRVTCAPGKPRVQPSLSQSLVSLAGESRSRGTSQRLWCIQGSFGFAVCCSV